MKRVKKLKTIHRNMYQPKLNKMEREAAKEDARKKHETFWPKWVKWFFGKKEDEPIDVDFDVSDFTPIVKGRPL